MKIESIFIAMIHIKDRNLELLGQSQMTARQFEFRRNGGSTKKEKDTSEIGVTTQAF